MLTRHLVFMLGMVSVVTASGEAWAKEHAKIDSVDGASTVLLQHGLALRDAAPGEMIEIGERIRTDEKTTVTISYSDGSHLTIFPNTDLEIEEPQGKVQSNMLHSGLVKGEVKKAKAVAPSENGSAPAKAPLKFVIRTKVATMGVRGTEFVAGFNAASGLAQFNTLSGSVEVAADPAQLMGGQGVSVASGQFVQATAEGGLSSVSTFSSSSFLSGLSGMAKSMGSNVPGTASSAAQSTVASSGFEGRSPPSVLPAPPAPAPKSPQAPVSPPPPPAVVEQKAVEAEQEKPHMHLVGFSLGGFFAQNPDPNTSTGIPYYRAFEINWTPTIPLPVLNFLYLRGSFGATLFENYSLNNAFLVHQYQLLAGTTLLKPLFAEVGGGEQIWRNENIDSGILSANAGLIISPNGRFNRLYGGVSKFFSGNGSFELHAGIGIQFF